MKLVSLIAALGLLAFATLRFYGISPEARVVHAARGPEAATEAGRGRIKKYFSDAGVSYPPPHTTLLYLKDERTLTVYAGADTPKKIRVFSVLAASGGPGPKLREGDEQVPEGIYRIESLNPFSQFHLSLRVNYPNKFDRENGAREKRRRLGGDIMIHGSAVSIGCIAIGDAPIEELYALARDTKFGQWKVLLAPTDLRVAGHQPPKSAPAWMAPEYARLAAEMKDLPR